MTKRALILAILTIVVTHTHSVYAQSVTPLNIHSIDDEISITGVSSPYCVAVYLPNTVEAQNYYPYTEICARPDDGYPQFNPFSWFNLIQDPSGDEFEGAYRLALVNDLNATCENITYEDCIASPAYAGQTWLVNFSATTNSTWGSDNGFWGDTTPATVISGMEASVAETGADIYPLLTFVGIPIAFLIALSLIWLINKQLTPAPKRGKEIINPNGSEFIEHSAEDLEFKREYGQPKRGRGRPRKNPL